MKRIFKWTLMGLLGLLIIAILFVGFLVARGEIQARSIYQEYQYAKLSEELANKTDADSVHRANVLAACKEYFHPDRSEDSYYCYKSVFKDQRNYLVPLYETESGKLTGLQTISSNFIYENKKVFGTYFYVGCQKNALGMSWSADDRLLQSASEISIFVDMQTPSIEEIENLGNHNIALKSKEISANLLNQGLDAKVLTINYLNENSVERQFRFNIQDLDKHLPEIRENCVR